MKNLRTEAVVHSLTVTCPTAADTFSPESATETNKLRIIVFLVVLTHLPLSRGNWRKNFGLLGFLK